MNNALLIGLDLSLASTGVAVKSLWGTQIQTWTIRPAQSFVNSARLESLARQLFQALELQTDLVLTEGRQAFAAVEDYARGGSGQRHSLAEWGGIVRLKLYQLGVPLLVVNPATLKLWCVGSGSAEKSDMAAAMLRRTGRVFESSDECDAAALVCYLQARLNGTRPASMRGQAKSTAALWRARWALPYGMADHWRTEPLKKCNRRSSNYANT